MLVELVAAGSLVFWPPAFLAETANWLSFGLLITAWLSTFSLQIPYHRKLAQAFDPQSLNRLIQTNWIRCLCWSFRSILLLLSLI